MGNTIFIKDRRVCVKPLHSQLETIQKIKTPTMAKQCKVLQEWSILLVYFVQNYRSC